MRDVIADVLRWWEAGHTVGVATVVSTWRSAPRQPGAAMAVGPAGEAVGSVSGGCVEGAVYEVAQQVVATGTPQLVTYGVSDDDAFAVGLTCGGVLDVFVEPVDRNTFPDLGIVAAAIAAERPVAVVTAVSGPGAIGAHRVVGADLADSNGTGPRGSLGSRRLDEAVDADVAGLLDHGTTGLLHYGPDGERRRDELTLFVASYAARPRMLVFGAIDFAAAVARIGRFLGYRVTVCDARPVFATGRRFPEADEVVVDWPHRYLERTLVDAATVICVLTHDPKFDVPVLQAALRTDAGYIGAMGSRRTHDDRVARLREAGVSEADLARIASPIGLDIGARTPEETAVSIAAEIVQSRWGGSGAPLASTDGPIHRAARRAAALTGPR